MSEGRDRFWHELLEEADAECEPEPMDAEDPLYILYTSGSTGKPKGILHTTAGYLTGVTATHKLVFDLHRTTTSTGAARTSAGSPATPTSSTGRSPTAPPASCTRGRPNYPAEDRWWEIIERYGVTIFYTAPTAIRACMKWGTEHPQKHDLSSLRLLGSVGEPINPRAWLWYHEHIGGGRCPIVDTWWQTETGAIMITPLPGLTTTKPGSATVPFPGIEAKIFDSDGERDRGGRRHPGPDPALALDGAHPLQGARPLRRDLLGPLREGHLPGRRRRPARRGRLLLDRRPHRRRHQRLRPPPLDDGGRVHARLQPAGRRGGGDRRSRRAHRAGDHRLRHPRGRRAPDELADELREHVADKIGKLARPKRIVDLRRPAEDPLGQDHAAAAARHRHGRATWATSPPCATPRSSRTCRGASPSRSPSRCSSTSPSRSRLTSKSA